MTTIDVQERVQRRVGNWYERSNARWCYLFLIPAVILTAMFTLYPMVMSWVYSTMNWTGFGKSMQFVGLGNYREIIHDDFFWRAFARSLVFMIVGTPVRVILALFVALILNRQALKFSPAFRTMFFLPVTAAASVMGVVMTFVLSPNNGPISTVLTGTHIVSQPVSFLSDPNLALWTTLGVQVWKNFGITMIYWLAALQTIPRDYVEAGAVDGAGPWQQLRYITLPILVPFAMIIVILTANDNLHAFAMVQALTAGGPYYKTQLIEVYIYQTAFQPADGAVPRLGYASAAGCFFGTATLLLALAQAWAAKKVADVRRATAADRGPA